MSEVALVNTSRRTHVIVLDHEVFRSKKYGFSIVNQVAHDESQGGVRTSRMMRRALPGSITLQPGQRIEGLHPAIEKVTQVAALLATQQVAIEPMETATTLPAPHPPQVDQPRARLGAKRDRDEAKEG
jgi:hypothetical protein